MLFRNPSASLVQQPSSFTTSTSLFVLYRQHHHDHHDHHHCQRCPQRLIRCWWVACSNRLKGPPHRKLLGRWKKCKSTDQRGRSSLTVFIHTILTCKICRNTKNHRANYHLNLLVLRTLWSVVVWQSAKNKIQIVKSKLKANSQIVDSSVAERPQCGR